MDNVAHLWVLLAQLTAVPPRARQSPIPTAYIVRLVDIISIITHSQFQSLAPYKRQCQSPGEECHNLHNCLAVPVHGVVRAARHSAHSIRGVKSSHGRQPYQAVHRRPVRPVSQHSPSSLGPSSAAGGARMPEDELTPRLLNMIPMNALS